MNGAARKATVPIAMIAARQDGCGPRGSKAGPHGTDDATMRARRWRESRTNSTRDDDREERDGVGHEGGREAERRDGGTGQRRTDDPASVELGEFSELAARNSDRGTRSGRIAWLNGPISAEDRALQRDEARAA